MTAASHRVCVDVGSTFTKAALVDVRAGTLLATAEHPTTSATDVLDGVDACLAELDAEGVPVLACSSAGGGLRVAVVGNEALVTSEAGRRVALSSGGTVVHVAAGVLDGTALEDLREARPDVVLLTGGTDGGNAEVLLTNAATLARAGLGRPVVLAGNAEAQPGAAVALDRGRVAFVAAENIVPRIGVLRPESARAAIRAVFLRHVIGGKGLSARDGGRAFVRLVRGPTPDVVLTGVEVLARRAGDVVVVDVGGATTDVHSVVDLDPEARADPDAIAHDVVAPTAVTRTVEGDLGMRWSALTAVEAAGRDDLRDAAARRAADPGLLPATDAEREDDEAIAGVAAGLALRRHAGRARVVVTDDGRVVERSGTDLRRAALVVLSGGVLRHGRPGVAQRVLAGSTGGDVPGGWQLPEAPRVVVDGSYVLAAVGLLADEHPGAAAALAGTLAI